MILTLTLFTNLIAGTPELPREILCDTHWYAIQFNMKHGKNFSYKDFHLTELPETKKFEAITETHECRLDDNTWKCSLTETQSAGLYSCRIEADPVAFICETFPMSEVTDTTAKDYYSLRSGFTSEFNIDEESQKPIQLQTHHIYENKASKLFEKYTLKEDFRYELSSMDRIFSCQLTYKR